jgi:lipid II:glycine glycyltransferase (peptidoglycan interpeptide bridge formation enzyme)
MAKQAKAPAIEISDKDARKFLADIFEHLAEIDSARGSFMNLARREREQMTAIYESLAAKGVSQKISKLVVKIAQADEKIRGWQSELEDEEKKIAIKLAKAIGDRRQLSFWDTSSTTKPMKARKSKKTPAPVPSISEHDATVGSA